MHFSNLPINLQILFIELDKYLNTIFKFVCETSVIQHKWDIFFYFLINLELLFMFAFIKYKQQFQINTLILSIYLLIAFKFLYYHTQL